MNVERRKYVAELAAKLAPLVQDLRMVRDAEVMAAKPNESPIFSSGERFSACAELTTAHEAASIALDSLINIPTIGAPRG